VEKFATVYSNLETQMVTMTQDKLFVVLRQRFDSKFPAYIHFTDVKKLDLLLWQYRS